jgi:hypothetical protein
MFRAELPYFILFALVALITPFLPSVILLSFDNMLVRILIVAVLLYLISIGPTVGIIGLVAIALIYLERNRRKVKVAAEKLDAMDYNLPAQATVQEASEPQKTVPVKEFDKPAETEVDFFAHEGCDSGDFEAVAPTINEKEVLYTIYPLHKSGPEAGTAANSLYERLGFGHIPGVTTMGDADM